MTPNAIEYTMVEELAPVVTTKSGIDLDSFQNVSLYKVVPAIPPVTDVKDALARLGNDHAKLLTIIHAGLQAEAVTSARSNSDNWLVSEDGKKTDKTYSGSLIRSEVLNPAVLLIAKMNFDYDKATDADSKRAAKDSAKKMISEMPQMVAGLKKKSAELDAEGAETSETAE